MRSLDAMPGQSSTCTARTAQPFGRPCLSLPFSTLAHAVSTSFSVAAVSVSGPKWKKYAFGSHVERRAPNQTQSSYGPCSRRASSLAFGQRLRWHNRTITHFRSASQLALGRMVRHRLLCSQRCRALSPRSADLFFAPVLTAPKTHGQYVLACNRTPAAMVQSELRYLSHDRACRAAVTSSSCPRDTTLREGVKVRFFSRAL
jgi:hypothetical protein